MRLFRALHHQEPVAIVQAAGDALLLDLRTFHFGSANRSERVRVQLSATFREPSGEGEQSHDGFTYALREERRRSRYIPNLQPEYGSIRAT